MPAARRFVYIIKGIAMPDEYYLYDYEPITDDEELNQPRAFPCTEFIVRRHKKEGYVAESLCSGTVLEPEVVAPPVGKGVERASAIPEDGKVISGRTYDQIMRDSLSAQPQAGR